MRSYLEAEEAFGDQERAKKIERLVIATKKLPFNVETIIFALDYDKIAALFKKKNEGVIEDIVFWDQIRKLSVVSFEPKKVVELLKKINPFPSEN